MKPGKFRRGLMPILLVIALVTSMVFVAMPAYSGGGISHPHGTTITVIQGGKFLLRYKLYWDEPGVDGMFGIVINWYNYENKPTENLTFISAEAYWADNYDNKITCDTPTLEATPSGADTMYTLTFQNTSFPNSRDDNFFVDIWISASGARGAPHAPRDNHPILAPAGLKAVTVFEASIVDIDGTQTPITIKINGWTGPGTVVSGRDNCYATNRSGTPPPFILYNMGDRPPVMVARRGPGSGAVIAGGISSSLENFRWNAATALAENRLPALLHAAFQWGKPGAKKVAWHVYYNVYSGKLLPLKLTDNMKADYGYEFYQENRTIAAIEADNLDNYDVFVIPQYQLGARWSGGDPSLLPDSEVAILKSFVENGGVLLVCEGPDFSGYGYSRVSNKILKAMTGFNRFFQDDSLYDNVDNYGPANYNFKLNVDNTTAIGALYQGITGKTSVGLYSPISLAPWPTLGVTVTISPDENKAENGATVTFTVTVTNTGSSWDNFKLSISEDNAWGAALDKSYLENGGTAKISVTIPAGAEFCAVDHITVTARSLWDNTVSGSDNCTAHCFVAYYGVDVSISPSEESGLPGQTLSYTVTVRNTGNVIDTYTLENTDNSGWVLRLENNSLEVPENESRTTTLRVTIPDNAVPCTRNNIIVTATSQGDNTKSDNDNCIAHATEIIIIREVVASISPSSQSGAPGSTLDYTVTVANTGNVSDTYDLEASGGWPAQISPTSLTVAAGGSGTATLSVTIPSGTSGGATTTITVTATGTGVSDSASCDAVATPPPSIEWDALITATFSGGSDDAIFGARLDASSGFDSKYDIPEPPAPPEPPHVRAYFYYPEQAPDELHRSCLAPENLMEWPLRIEYADDIEDITLTWSVGNIPPEYSVLLYRGGDLLADMRAEDNYTFEASAGSYDFRIFVGTIVPFTLKLTQGWNMISLPVAPQNPDPDAIFGGAYYVMYRWDAENKRYVLHADSGGFVEPDPNVEVGVGYWIFSLENRDVVILGSPLTQLTLNLRMGWNMVGSLYRPSSIADPADDPDGSVLPWAFTWDASQRRYTMGQLLEPGKGYWIYALRDCSLVLSIPKPAAVFKIAIVSDIGGRGDLSFNDMAFKGGEDAERDFGVEMMELISKTEADYTANLRTAAQDPDVKLIVGVGFLLSSALASVSGEFPDKNFVGIDTYASAISPRPNLMDVVFEEHKGSAAVGALAGLLAAYYNKPYIGVVLGIEISVLWKFEIGYKWGCDWAMSWIENNKPDMEQGIYNTPRKERVLWTYTGTFDDITKGYLAAQPMYATGAVAVYNVAGPLGWGINSAVKDIAKRDKLEMGPPFWIGVDADQDWINPGFCIASMMKRVDRGVYYTTKLVLENKFRQAVTQYGGWLTLGIGTSIMGEPVEGISVSTLADLDEFIAMGVRAEEMTGEPILPGPPEWIKEKAKEMRDNQPAWIWDAVSELENKIRTGAVVVPLADTKAVVDNWRAILG